MKTLLNRLLHIDDHPVVPLATEAVLKPLFPGCHFDAAADILGASELLQANRYDLVILDIQIPGMDAESLLKKMLLSDKSQKVLVYSCMNPEIYARRFLKLGAKGFLCKDEPVANLHVAVAKIINGSCYMSETLVQFLAKELMFGTTDPPFSQLTINEFKVMYYLSSGNNTNSIANLLQVKPTTVINYARAIFRKLGVAKITELQKMVTSHRIHPK